MSVTDVTDFTQLFSETLARVRARLDADANAGLTEDDPAFIDTREGSFYWDVTQPPAMECARLWDAMTETAAAAFPSTAWGDYLDQHGLTFNLVRIPAESAVGTLMFVAREPTLIAAGTQVSSVASQTGDVISFQTTESGTTCDALLIPANVQIVAEQSGGTLIAATRYYHVTALNEFGETTGSSDTAAVTTSDAGRNTITWDAVDGAASYQVYVATTENTLGDRVGSTAATTFIDDGSLTPSGQQPQINLTSGVVLAAAAVTPGTEGSVAAGAISSLDTVLPSVYSVNNPDRFQGGAEAESDDDFRVRIMGEYLGSAGGGNVADYKRWATGEGVERVSVIPVWDGPGTVLVIVMQRDGSPVLQSIIDRVQQYLDPDPGLGNGQAPIGATVTVGTSTLVDIDIVAEVIPQDGYSLDGAQNTIAYRNTILTALQTYLRSLEPGDTVVYEHIQACFFVPGVHNIQGVTVNGTVDPEYPLAGGATPEVARLGTVTLTEPS